MITMLNRGSLALLLVLVAWGGGQASAQSAPVAVETSALGSKEMLTGTTGAIERMRGMVGQIQDLLRKAEERGDAEGIQCVRDKLSSSRAMVDVSVLARNAMQEALAANQQGKANAEYRKVEVAQNMVDQFLAEAMSCLSDTSESSEEVLRDAVGDGTGDASLGDLASVIDIGEEGPQFTPHQ